jgi:hypothetical protein
MKGKVSTDRSVSCSDMCGCGLVYGVVNTSAVQVQIAIATSPNSTPHPPVEPYVNPQRGLLCNNENASCFDIVFEIECVK